MTFLGHRPHEVYRVYSEGEFFDGAAQKFLDGVERESAGEEPPATGGNERRLRRLAGAAMLAGAVGTVGGVVVIHTWRETKSVEMHDRSGSVAGRSRTYFAERPARSPGGHLIARAETTVRVRPAGDGPLRQHGRQQRVALADTADSSSVPGARRHGERSSIARSGEAPVKPGWPASELRSASSGESRVASRIVALSTTSVAAHATSVHPEFGFER